MNTVTEIIGEVYRPFEGFKIDEWYLERGTQVHSAMAAICLGQKILSYDPRIEGYIKAGELFISTYKPIILAVEERIENTALQITGKPDLIARIKYRGSRIDIIIDWKCGVTGYELIQLGGYGLLAKKRYGMAVLLNSDGTFKIAGKGVTDISNIWRRRFLATLTVFNTIKEIKK